MMIIIMIIIIHLILLLLNIIIMFSHGLQRNACTVVEKTTEGRFPPQREDTPVNAGTHRNPITMDTIPACKTFITSAHLLHHGFLTALELINSLIIDR